MFGGSWSPVRPEDSMGSKAPGDLQVLQVWRPSPGV